jgi:cytidylate kinase
MFRVVTGAREYGAGGSIVAQKVAGRLGWNLLDRALIGAVARAAQVDVETAARYDEHVESWWRRFHRRGLWNAAIEGGIAPADAQFFDPETMAMYAQEVIARAAARGNSVIVGRGAQCALRNREDVLHVFIYGPWGERVSRVRSRLKPTGDVVELIRLTDRERFGYIDLFRMRLEGSASLPHDDQLGNRPGEGRRDDRRCRSAK